MFGYVRPHKAELKVKEFVRYRSVYCGICKTISRRYGQLPRLAATYDMTFLALFLLALNDEDPGSEMQACVLHPLNKNPMALASDVLDFAAAAAVLLARYKFKDDLEDGERILASGFMNGLFFRAAGKAARDFPALDRMLAAQLDLQRAAERAFFEQPELTAITEPFAGLLGGLMALAPVKPEPEEKMREALVFLGRKLGAWIYLIDAWEDKAKDAQKKRFNPLLGEGGEQRQEEALQLLEKLEDEIDAVASLLPFYRDAAILSNIIQEGLPSVRTRILHGEKLLPL